MEKKNQFQNGNHSARLRRIGQLSAELAVPSKTIRYYEATGLLPSIRRSPSGYRQYSQADCDRLRFILQAKHMQLTLHEIADILSVCDQGEAPCSSIASLLDRKLAVVDEQLQNLRTLRRQFAEARKDALQKCCALRKILGKF